MCSLLDCDGTIYARLYGKLVQTTLNVWECNFKEELNQGRNSNKVELQNYIKMTVEVVDH